jgi:hypothetical protein
LIRELQGDPDAASLVEAMAASRRPDDRMWAAGFAADILGHDAVPILRRLARSASADLRQEALVSLTELDPAAARQLLPRIVKGLHSKDYWDPYVSLWTLASMGAVEAVPAIREVMTEWNPAHADHRVAEIVINVLTGRHQEILGELLGHEHRATLWLAMAADTIGTTEAVGALERAAASLPDDECRMQCLRVLDRRHERTLDR